MLGKGIRAELSYIPDTRVAASLLSLLAAPRRRVWRGSAAANGDTLLLGAYATPPQASEAKCQLRKS